MGADLLGQRQKEEILTYMIRSQSGFKVQALSSRPSNPRGLQETW